MVKKGLDLESIIAEINNKFFRLFPSDRFFCAVFLEIEHGYKNMKVWNAGMPCVLLTNHDGVVNKKISSMDMPLGIQEISKSNIKLEQTMFTTNNRIYIYTDGITECCNPDGLMFGEQRLIESLSITEPDKRFDNVISNLEDFRNDAALIDDISFVEINCDKSKIDITIEDEHKQTSLSPMNWSLRLDMEEDVLRNVNPVPVILQTISDIQGLNNDHSRLFMVLTEMYSNALEHGILELDSSIKHNPDGFMKYYEERQSNLEELKDASLSIDISSYAEGTKGVISITIEDSGDGFDSESIESSLDTNNTGSGRGIALLKSMCRKLEYDKNGSKLNVEYEWNQ